MAIERTIMDPGYLARHATAVLRRDTPTTDGNGARAGAEWLSVLSIDEPRAAQPFVAEWEALAATAIEPNVFYEPWMALPALEAYGAGRDIAIVLVVRHDAANASRLVGVFPIERGARFGQRRIGTTGLWQYPHCYLCTPLVAPERASDTVAAFLGWLRARKPRSLLSAFDWIGADGPFERAFRDAAAVLRIVTRTSSVFDRGLWRSGEQVDPEMALSSQLRRRLRRDEKRLERKGRLVHRVLDRHSDVGRWVDEFLSLEASGWKGRQGTALGCSPEGRRFFANIATAAFARNRLLMIGLDLDGRPIARRCAFVARDGAFAFKTAYDEAYGAHSPGGILERDSIRQLRNLADVQWMDSCAAPDNLLINRLSNARRRLRSVVAANGMLGEFVVSGISLMRWTRQPSARERAKPVLPALARRRA
jgi:CelD/BcsL family acetyltransferase involved in cellulose biosynthesis